MVVVEVARVGVAAGEGEDHLGEGGAAQAGIGDGQAGGGDPVRSDAEYVDPAAGRHAEQTPGGIELRRGDPERAQQLGQGIPVGAGGGDDLQSLAPTWPLRVSECRER